MINMVGRKWGGGEERRLQVSFTVLYFQAGHDSF